MRQTIKWIGVVLLLAGGCWGLAALYMDTVASAEVYRYELADLVSFARIIACIFIVFISATLIQMVRRAHSHSTISTVEHGLYAITFGLALGFIMAGLTVAKVPGLLAVTAILNFPAIFLTFGWLSLGFGPHGDAGWNILFWMPILQWLIIFGVVYFIRVRTQKKTN